MCNHETTGYFEGDQGAISSRVCGKNMSFSESESVEFIVKLNLKKHITETKKIKWKSRKWKKTHGLLIKEREGFNITPRRPTLENHTVVESYCVLMKLLYMLSRAADQHLKIIWISEDETIWRPVFHSRLQKKSNAIHLVWSSNFTGKNSWVIGIEGEMNSITVSNFAKM